MAARLTGVLAAALAALAVLAVPATAQQLPSGVKQVYNDFRTDGVISPCQHTSGQLAETRRLIPPDIEQYAPDFPAALDAAIEARARGECDETAPATPPPATTAPPAATPAPAAGVPTRTVVPKPPEPETVPVSTTRPTPAEQADAAVARVAAAVARNDPPAPVWLLLVAAALLAAAALFVLVARRTRRGEEWLAGFRHSWGEMSFRAGGTWAEFRDFVRLGR